MKNTYLISSFLLFLAVACTVNRSDSTDYSSYMYDHKPMLMDTANSIQCNWDHKEVFETLKLDGAESLENWELTFGSRENVGEISLSDEQVFEGNSSIKFVCPTKLPEDLGPGGRYWGRQNLTRFFDSEDFSEYNRIAVNIYPVFKGFRKLYLTIILHLIAFTTILPLRFLR